MDSIKRFIVVLLVLLMTIPVSLISTGATIQNSTETILSTNFVQGGAYNENGELIYSTSKNYARTVEFTDIKAFNKISVEKNSNTDFGTISFRVVWYDANKNFIGRSNAYSLGVRKYFTVENSYAYARFYFYNNAGVIQEMMNAFKVVGMSIVTPTLIDSSKKGSLTIYDYSINNIEDAVQRGTGEASDYSEYLNSIGATAVSGVSFKVTRVVDETFVNGNGTNYYRTNGIVLPTVNDVVTSLNAKDGTFTKINEYTTSPTNNNGQTSINNLPLGIYLVEEGDGPASLIQKTSKYLVSVPTTSSNGKSWNYDIVTFPKSVNGVVLTYDANNGSSPAQQTSEPRRANKTEPLTKNMFTNGSKMFLGWADNPDDKEPDYYDEQDFNMPDHDKTIYAVWGYTNSIRYYTEFKYSEPWGLKLSALLINPNTKKAVPYTSYNNYGIYIYPKHSIGNKLPSLSEVLTKGKKYTNETTEWEIQSLTFNDGSVDEYPIMTFDEDIFTQNLNDDIFAVSYITYKGRTFWGQVKNRNVKDSVESIIKSKQIGLTTYTDAEVNLATAINTMYEAVRVYYNEKMPEIKEYPKGTDVATANLPQNCETKEFVHRTSLSAYSPWGLRLQAKPEDIDDFSDVENCGCIVYEDTRRELVKEIPNVEVLLQHEGTYVSSVKNGKAQVQKENVDNKNYITVYHKGILSYRLAQTDVYTCFFYVKNGKTYYSNVKRRNCYLLAESEAERFKGQPEGDVYTAMINLYRETYFYKNGKYPIFSDSSLISN